jgi:S-adenosylmethionine-diacylglycerol 3-amino-3-carboxypropyl transferase
MSDALDWVDAAARMPVAFAQVREDPLVDLAVLDQLGGTDLRVMMIASGGCTAAALAASGRIAELHLVDANNAQIALTQLKLRLLQWADPADRARLLGHAPMPALERAGQLADLLEGLDFVPHALGPLMTIAELGPDHAGRYELLFARLRAELHTTTPGSELPATTRIGFDDAFDHVMSLPNLVRLFGEEATQNSREPFARHFAGRTRQALADPAASENPYLWQMLLGRFPPNVVYHWLTAPPPPIMPRVTYATSTMDAALAESADDFDFDFVHLSNILDWLAPDEARETLWRAWAALRPGGCVLIRQLNSTLDIPALGEGFDWDAPRAAELHARDRSFFYRSLHLGRKPR